MKHVSLGVFKNEELLSIAICSFIVLVCFYLIYRKHKNKELLYLGSVVVIYGIISIWNLGSFEMPISTWQPTTDNQSFILELSQSEFEQINIIYGEGDNNSLVGEYEYQLGVNGIVIEGSNDLGVWDNIVTLDEGLIYEYQSIKGCFNYKYIRVNSSSKLNTITEIAFYNKESIVGTRVYEDRYDDKYPASLVIDEQEMIEIDPIYYDEFFLMKSIMLETQKKWQMASICMPTLIHYLVLILSLCLLNCSDLVPLYIDYQESCLVSLS